jgi:ankyrin repeat protein
LLDHGTDVNRKGTFGGLTRGQGVTAPHIAAEVGYMAMVKLLVERGADLAIQDDPYGGTAEGRADHFEQTEVRDYLSSVA